MVISIMMLNDDTSSKGTYFSLEGLIWALQWVYQKDKKKGFRIISAFRDNEGHIWWNGTQSLFLDSLFGVTHA